MFQNKMKIPFKKKGNSAKAEGKKGVVPNDYFL